MVHTAITLGVTRWSDEVTDEEYGAVVTTEETALPTD
jgi:hypothetical protein